MNKPSGDMYGNCYTWNPLGGVCLHNCNYCYVRHKIEPRVGEKYRGKVRLMPKELKVNLKIPEDKVLFVQSCGDLFGAWVSDEVIKKVLVRCAEFDNQYLFQSKNPWRFYDFQKYLPTRSILGTTIETNRDYKVSEAPSPYDRYRAMAGLRLGTSWDLMVSVEPVMGFDLEEMLSWMLAIKPTYVSIGADSCGCGLEEPPRDKIERLIQGLSAFTEVRVKENLRKRFNI